FERSKGTTYADTLSAVYEGTFGGPAVKDRLWFFGSGRYGSVDNQLTLPQTGAGRTSTDTTKRGEIKVTGTVAPNHTLQGGYLNNAQTTTNDSGVLTLIIDPRSLVTRSRPNWYVFTNYRGVTPGDVLDGRLSNLLVEAQYSERRFRFDG